MQRSLVAGGLGPSRGAGPGLARKGTPTKAHRKTRPGSQKDPGSPVIDTPSFSDQGDAH
jgi:hypothetical protein